MALITESDAATKQCPVVKLPDQLQCAGAAPQTIGFDVTPGFIPTHPFSTASTGFSMQPRCLGSACMAWRWEAYRGKAVPDGEGRRGYCGAFGIPMESIV